MTLAPGPTLAEHALAEFTARRDTARARLREGALRQDQAEALLRPWAALALRCGADPAAIHDSLRLERDELREGPAQLAPHIIAALQADDLCPRAGILDALGPACNAAVERAIADPAADRTRRADRLMILAVAIGHTPARQVSPAPAAARQPESAAA